MKKIFLFSAAILFCASTFADITRKCTITMTSDQGGTDVLKLIEDDDYTSAFENEADASKAMNSGNSTNLNIYVNVPQYIPNDSLMVVVTDDIEDYPISIQTNKVATNYTFTFTKVVGTVYLYDAVENSLTLMANNGTYEFTADADKFIFGRFKIGFPIYPREVADGNWGTICFPYKFESMKGVASLYTLTAKNTAGTKVALDEVALANVVAGTPYFFQSNAAAQEFKYKPENEAASAGSVNGLIGTFVEIEETTEQKWVLTKNTITPAAVGSTVGQYRCYIDLELTPKDDTKFVAGAPGRKIFDVVGAQTALENVDANTNATRKMIVNGQLVIVKDGKMFNAQGAQL